ncbi:MAG TPA: OmpA family protein [Reyranella sp.]|jgi:outer membrane protein OmpA-like peptidoglycan-associated protein
MMSRIVPALLLALALPACDNKIEPPPNIDCFGPPMVFFDEGSAEVSEKAKKMLFGAFTREPGFCSYGGPNVFVCLTGNTDKTGDESANRRLSLRRAEAVAKYLVEIGVAHDHMAVRGLGSSQPMVPNGLPSEPQNRRVEVGAVQESGLANCK